MTETSHSHWHEYPSPSAPYWFDSRNRRKTASLFAEKNRTDEESVFTLRDYHEPGGLPSLYALYMDSIDEADFAMKAFGGLPQWSNLLKSTWFMEGDADNPHVGVNQWRQDKAALDASKAKKVLLDKMADGDLQAAKVLYGSAVRGELAGGISQGTPKKKAEAKRRGTQKDSGKVVDLDSILRELKND